MRIADLDTSRGDDCPSGWTNITTPVPACRGLNTGCYSTTFSTLGISYSKVCGMAVGYQKSTPDGFAAALTTTKASIDGIICRWCFYNL